LLVMVTVRQTLTRSDVCRLLKALKGVDALAYPISIELIGPGTTLVSIERCLGAALELTSRWFTQPDGGGRLPCAGFINALPLVRSLRCLASASSLPRRGELNDIRQPDQQAYAHRCGTDMRTIRPLGFRS
jgi:hypothetical protein